MQVYLVCQNLYKYLSLLLIMVQITITLPEELIIKGKEHAKLTGKTFSGMVRVGLQKELEKELKNENE